MARPLAIALSLLLAFEHSTRAADPAAARFRGTGKADPVRIANIRKAAGPAGQSAITFDLAWDHSWRAAWQVPEQAHGGKGTLNLESWDAAWVFAKFRKAGADGWSHATLSAKAADHVAPAAAKLDVGLTDDGTKGAGVFAFRATAGSGPNDWKGVTLRWLNEADGVTDPGAAEVKVFAIQMVFVPECAYWPVDASVRITLIDRDVPSYFQSLEHLLRYCARPPFALERLSVMRGEDGRIACVRYVLPRHKAANWVGPGRGRKSTRPGANGVVELSPFDFLDRLADLVPPPRKHRHRYHGVFAPNHKLRSAVTALAIGNVGKRCDAATDGHAVGGHAACGDATADCCDSCDKPPSHDTSRIAWAKLMARVGEEFPLECPGCGGDIRLIAFITDPGPIRKVLTHLGEPLEPPPVSPARGPPTDWGELVQVHDDRAIFQASPVELPDIDIHSL
jgi:hypothetical protein